MKKLSFFQICSLIVIPIVLLGCPQSDEPEIQTYNYPAVRSHCDPVVISVKTNQTVTITVTGQVVTNENGFVADCDSWTNANGIPDCHYINEQDDLHDLPFMALIGKFNNQYFLVGTSFERNFTSAGNLELSVNDWGGCGDDSDNAGTFVISVKIE